MDALQSTNLSPPRLNSFNYSTNIQALEHVNQRIRSLSINITQNFSEKIQNIEKELKLVERSIAFSPRDISPLKSRLHEIMATFDACIQNLYQNELPLQAKEMESLEDKVTLLESKLVSEALLKDTFQDFAILRFDIVDPLPDNSEKIAEAMSAKLTTLYQSAYPHTLLEFTHTSPKAETLNHSREITFDYKFEKILATGRAKMVIFENQNPKNIYGRLEIHQNMRPQHAIR